MLPPSLSLEIEDFLANLRKTITATFADTVPTSAVTFLDSAEGSSGNRAGKSATDSAGQLPRVRSAQTALRALITDIGSLPPSPPTLRGRAGRPLVGLANKFTWWQTNHIQRLANILREVTDELAHKVAETAPRQRSYEQGLTQLRRRVESLDALGSTIQEELEMVKTRLRELDSIEQRLEELESRLTPVEHVGERFR
jgi:hypothetical protein